MRDINITSQLKQAVSGVEDKILRLLNELKSSINANRQAADKITDFKQFKEISKQAPAKISELSSKYDLMQLWDMANTVASAAQYARQNNLVKEGESLEMLMCMFYMYMGRCDLPNDLIEVDIKDERWLTRRVKSCNSVTNYILQVYRTQPDFARILKSRGAHYERVARGTLEAMEEKLTRLGEKQFFRRGDIVVVDRSAYELGDLSKLIKDKTGKDMNVKIPLPLYAHFGICVGPDEIIHFAGKSDFVGKKTVHSSTVKEFLNSVHTQQSDKEIYIVHCPGPGKRPYKLFPDTSKISFNVAHVEILDCIDYKKLGWYDATTTIQRAKEKMALSGAGLDKEYSIIFYNCEDLAFYCKTGIYLSQQAENIENASKMLMKFLAKESWTPLVLAYEALCSVLKSLKEREERDLADSQDN